MGGGLGEWGSAMHAPKIVTMDLPFGQDALWFAEFNIVAVRPGLDGAARERAIDRLQLEWRSALHPMAPTAA